MESTFNLELKEQNSTPILLVNFKVYVACQIVTLKCFLPFCQQQPETGQYKGSHQVVMSLPPPAIASTPFTKTTVIKVSVISVSIKTRFVVGIFL